MLWRIFQLKPCITITHHYVKLWSVIPCVRTWNEVNGLQCTHMMQRMCVYAYMRAPRMCVRVLSSYCLMSVESGHPWQMIFYHGQSLCSPKRPWSYFSIGFCIISIIYERADEIQSYSFFFYCSIFFACAYVPTIDVIRTPRLICFSAM